MIFYRKYLRPSGLAGLFLVAFLVDGFKKYFSFG